jgi:hypothetical protein
MSGTNLRTIWLTLRATNYTTAVFTNVITNLKGLDAAQRQAINSSLNLGKSAYAAGMLFNVLGTQMGGTFGKFLTYSSYLMFIVAGLSYLKAAIIFANSVLSNHAIIVNLLSSAYFRLGAAIGAGFAIFFILKDYLGPIPAAMLAIAAAVAILLIPLLLASKAMNVLTLGAAGGIATITNATAGISGMGASMLSAQHGTRYVGRTGPALLHEGEIVYNPSTGRPTQVGNDLQGGMGGGTQIDASMHVDTINTKADVEELNELLKKQGRRIANDQR